MRIKEYEFNLRELSGSIGDFGTLIPLSIALITINGLSFSAVFLMVGAFYFVSGFYYRLPIPVQPLKVVSAVAIASPDKVTLEVMAATGLIFAAILLFLAVSGLIDQVARLFTKPIVRGIQLGLGLVLMRKGVMFIKDKDLFVEGLTNQPMIGGMPVNLVVGMVAVLLVLLLLNNHRFPAALVVLGAGILVGVGYGAFDDTDWGMGATDMDLYSPSLDDFWTACYLLVLPQIPLTIGNAVIGTTDTVKMLFGKGEHSQRATNRAFAASMGLANIPTGLLAGMPMCHGAGGLAAHYRFGARTGGSNIMIGSIFIIIALAFGVVGVAILSSIPSAVLGVLLLFAGLELALLVRDVTQKQQLFIVFLIAGIGLATTNMGVAFGAGIVVDQVIRRARVEI